MPLASEALFKKMGDLLPTHGEPIVKKVGAVYLFELREKKGEAPVFITVNLKEGNGKVTFGKEGKADATFVMLDADFMKLAGGKLKAQDAFMTGKMKIKGNMAKAMKFTPDVLPKDAKL